jgi:hypothetical protein
MTLKPSLRKIDLFFLLWYVFCNVNISQYRWKIAGNFECACKMTGPNVNIGQCKGKIAGSVERECKMIDQNVNIGQF